MDNIQKILQLFQEKGTKQFISPAKPLPLNKFGSIYALEKGVVNLFVQLKNTEELEPRLFLAHLSSGLLFNYDPSRFLETYEILASSESEMELLELPIDVLQESLQNNEQLQKEFCFYIEQWVHLIPQNVAKFLSFELKYSIFPGQELEISGGQMFSAKKTPHTNLKEQISWIKLPEGKILLYGNENISMSSSEDIFPLTSHFCFKTEGRTKIRAIGTLAIIQNQLWQKGLTTFYQLFSQYLPLYLQKKQDVEKEILESRKSEEKKNLLNAFEQIESVLVPEVKLHVEIVEGLLEQVLQIISNRIKVKFVYPKVNSDKLKDYMEHVSIICEASHIRSRRVRLTGKWWKEDHGPLLAFYGEENKPVALIRDSKYRLIDKESNKPVTEEVAKNLAAYAYMFYTPFSSFIKSGRGVLQLIYKKFRAKISKLVIYGLAANIVAFFPPIATGILFDYAVPESSFSLTLYLFSGLVFSAIGFALFHFLRDFMLLKLQGLAANLVQPAIWDRLLKLSPSFFRKFTLGNLFWRTMAVEEIRVLLSGRASAEVLTGIFSLLYLVIMSIYAPSLTLLVLGIAFFGIVVTGICCWMKVRLLRESLEVQGTTRGMLVQMIGGVSKLRVAGAEKNAFAKWASLYANNMTLQRKIQTIQNIVIMLSAAIPILSFLGIYYAMLRWDSTQMIRLPDFLAFSVAFGRFSLGIFPISNTLMDLANIVPLWERAQVILEEPLEQTEEKLDPGKLTGEVNINNVTFGYDPKRPPILKDVSISIQPHEFIGIVGQSGVGKSTIIRLLLGFENPLSGAIYYDGKDLTKLDVRAVRHQLGIVLQGSGLMAGTVYDNIACGGLHEEHEVEEALRLSGMNQVLDDLPMGLHTFVQMNGTNLSGGQRQRLLLARALLGSPSILIFDEATSALDNQTQKMISSNIEELNVTRIVIAQRLSTIQNADRIYVIGKSGVLQQGAYEELAKQEGVFSEMLSRQKL